MLFSTLLERKRFLCVKKFRSVANSFIGISLALEAQGAHVVCTDIFRFSHALTPYALDNIQEFQPQTRFSVKKLSVLLRHQLLRRIRLFIFAI